MHKLKEVCNQVSPYKFAHNKYLHAEYITIDRSTEPTFK